MEIEIEGGFPVGELRNAEAGGLSWERSLGEDVEAFKRRVRAEADAASAKMLIFGGFPSSW